MKGAIGYPRRLALAVALAFPLLAACGNGDAVAIGAPPSGSGPCTPTTCATLGDDCGMVPDGCGGTLDCGACTAPAACGGGGKPNVCGASSGVQTYTTSFLLAEDPISEGGHWVNGQTVGLDWTNVRTTAGLAFGTQSGNGGHDDSTALLVGAWGPDQTVQATVRVVSADPANTEQVELRLRSALGPHSATGYEVNFRLVQGGSAYTQIARWNGALGDYLILSSQGGVQYGVKDGDVIKASIVGSTITVHLNGVQVNQASDGAYTTGSPGLGFDFTQPGLIQNYGLSSFTVTAQ